MICRLEQEEQARQKLQLEKVTADTKLKKFEEELAQHETLTAKVCGCLIHLLQQL